MRRKRLAAVAAMLIAGAVPTSAWADGGQSIATAPPVAFRQQEFGSTATGAYLTVGCGPGYRSFWGLPVTVGDLVTLDWESAMPTTEMVVAPVGTTDFNMADSDNLVEQSLSGGSKNEFQFTAPQSGLMPLWFRSCDDRGATPGPYAFVATDQHAIGIDLWSRLHMSRHAVLRATADLASGAPVPDGVTFYLTARWPNNHIARFTAVSSGGGLSFPVRLPRQTENRRVTFTVSRPADPEFLAAKSAPLSVKVALPRHSSPNRLACRRGFEKRRIHGKQRCVKFEKNRHRR